jgi:ABC-type lipoprotein export system ATPase subunit
VTLQLATEQPAAFELRDVGKTYESKSGPGFSALRNVSITIPQGSFTTIVGPSGSGKSTLLGLLGLLDRPTTGEVYLAGHPTVRSREKARCRLRSVHLGFVFQSFHLMTRRSVLENVALGGLYKGLPHSRRLSEARLRLDTVGLSQKESNLAGTLSGGERQRVAIARALVGGPPILLCDEPTGNLDSTNGQAVVHLLRQLADEGTTVVVVTHDLTIAEQGRHRISVLDGLVAEDG